MTQHTPGPWSIYDYGEEEAPTLVIHKDSATRVCFLATPGSHGDPARIEADAHLIAAAPNLLTALVDLVAAAITTGSKNHPIVQRAQEAIAQARPKS